MKNSKQLEANKNRNKQEWMKFQNQRIANENSKVEAKLEANEKLETISSK